MTARRKWGEGVVPYDGPGGATRPWKSPRRDADGGAVARAYVVERRARAARRDRIVIWIIGGVPLLWAIYESLKDCGGGP